MQGVSINGSFNLCLNADALYVTTYKRFFLKFSFSFRGINGLEWKREVTNLGRTSSDFVAALGEMFGVFGLCSLRTTLIPGGGGGVW